MAARLELNGKVRMGIYVPHELYEAVRLLAARKKVSMNDEVRSAIEQHLAKNWRRIKKNNPEFDLDDIDEPA